MSFPRVAPVTGTPRSTFGQLQIDPADPSPSLSATSSESSSPVPSTSQSRRKQKVTSHAVSLKYLVLPLAYEVWGKVMFSLASVILSTGCRGCSVERGCVV